MSNIDFQNGFALGVASKGFNNKKQIKWESKVEVIIPVDIYGNVTINNNNISVSSITEIVEE